MESRRSDGRPEKKRVRVFDSREVVHEDEVGTSGREEIQYVPRSLGASLSLTSGSSLSHKKSNRNISPPRRDDDANGHYVFELGENLTRRYKILRKLGEGTFGQVLECWDREESERVAIKIIRNVQKYRDAAMIEIDVLNALHRPDRGGHRCYVNCSGCVHMKRWFDYRNHVCMVFEKLGPSLFDFAKRNKFKPFPIDMVKDIGRQLLESVAYMHELDLIHTDLKPENILLISEDYVKIPEFQSNNVPPQSYKRIPASSEIKLIDFGSATFDSHYHCSVVSTRHYRAPEVILGLGWSFPCDLWSIGCILVELVTGEALFQTHENMEHLAMMERVLGPIPLHIIKKTERKGGEKYFKSGKELNWPDAASSRESIRAVKKLPRIRDLIMHYAEHSAGSLIDLLLSLMKFDPCERMTARDALRHPFFKDQRRL